MDVEPLPRAGVSKIVGLLEILEDKGGKDDIYKLARDSGLEFGEFLSIIKGAEMLGFVDTPGGDINITDTGTSLLKGKIRARKKFFKNQLKKLGTTQLILDAIKHVEDQRIERDVILDILAIHFPNEEPDGLFDTLVDWGRYAELFGYDADSEIFYLDHEN